MNLRRLLIWPSAFPCSQEWTGVVFVMHSLTQGGALFLRATKWLRIWLISSLSSCAPATVCADGYWKRWSGDSSCFDDECRIAFNGNLEDLAVAASSLDIVCTETNVSGHPYVTELLIAGLSSPMMLLRGGGRVGVSIVWSFWLVCP